WNSNFMTNSCTFCRICVNSYFTFINNGIKFILNRNIQNLSDMFQTEACIESFFSNTDTEHITLSCMVNAFDTVNVVVELTLNNWLKVRLHVLSGNLNNICNAVLASQFHAVYIRTNDGDLVVFDFRSVYSLYQLSTVYTRTIKLN